MNQSPPMPGSAQSQTCGLATWSLVLGIVAIVLCIICIGPLLGIPAVICGHLALGRIKRSNGAMRGHGSAIGGLVTGYVSIAMIPIIGLLSVIAIPNFVKARKTAQMNACINHLRLIDNAKQQWALENNKTSEVIPTADDLKPYLGKDEKIMICPVGGTYQINALNVVPTCTIPDHVLTQ